MAQESRKPRFPAPILNPQSSSQDEKTDPHLERAPVHSQSEHKPNSSTTPNTKMPDLGPLNPWMKDPSITEIMINDVRNIILEKNGRLTPSGFAFQQPDDLNRLIQNLLAITGKDLTAEQPYVDTMLPDGSRINIIGPPLTVDGPSVTIRKFPNPSISIHDLMHAETLDQKMAYFLNACVLGRLNILVCGGTGSGKTTLLNILTAFIPKEERLITIEDTPELYIQHINSVRLQIKPQTPLSPAISARDLLVNALRMRPDRIIVGECRRAEAFDMLQAMNTGHAGSMTTLHANSPRDGLSRLETLCLLAGVDLPLVAIRKQMASAIDLIIQIQRFKNGKRRIIGISEVTGMEGEVITLQDIFSFESNQAGETGIFKSTGLVPTFLEKLKEHGVELPRNYFG